MLSGVHEHTLDEKNRLTLPARFRPHFAEGLVLTRDVDSCVSIYTKAEFSRTIEARLAGLDPFSSENRQMRRYYYSGATEASPDRQGRVMVPQVLIQSAGLDREVTVVGVLDHLEIWDRAAWRDHMKQLEENIENAAERLAAQRD
jgi:MraZ protein